MAKPRGGLTRRSSAPIAPRGRRNTDDVGRQGLREVLGRCTERERLVLALLLVERLSALEAAGSLGISIQLVQRTYRRAFARLQSAARKVRTRPTDRHRSRVASERAPLRKAS